MTRRLNDNELLLARALRHVFAITQHQTAILRALLDGQDASATAEEMAKAERGVAELEAMFGNLDLDQDEG